MPSTDISARSKPSIFGADAIDAALLDLDGTLVDTLGDFCAALQRMLLELPAPFCTLQLAPTQVAHWIGKGSSHLVRSVLEYGQSGAAAAYLVPALARYQHHYAAINGRYAQVYAGVLPGLQQLRARGLPLACVTNKPTRFAQDLLQRMGLAGFFDLTVGGDAVAHPKPHPEALLRACAALGSAPARTLMIGDSQNDALAARAAGCPVLLLTYGYNHGEPVRAVDADGFANALDQLPWRS